MISYIPYHMLHHMLYSDMNIIYDIIYDIISYVVYYIIYELQYMGQTGIPRLMNMALIYSTMEIGTWPRLCD